MSKSTETLIGIDYGNKKVGIALGRGGFVVPIKTLSNSQVMGYIHELIKIGHENNVTKFIIGLPLSESEKETLQSKEVRQFAKLLRIASKKPTEFVNEYYSTHEAITNAIHMGIGKRSRGSQNDHLAAAVILKRYYEENK